MLAHCSVHLEDEVGNTVLWFSPIGGNIPFHVQEQLGGRRSRAMDQSKCSFKGKSLTSILGCCDQVLGVSNGLSIIQCVA